MATEDATRDIKEIRADVDAIREKVAKYRDDSERLDWLVSRPGLMVTRRDYHSDWWNIVRISDRKGVTCWRRTYRKAIDEAMKAGL